MAAALPARDDAFMAAASAGDVDAVGACLERGAAAHYQDEASGESVLMRAAGQGHLAVVELLLERGAPWNALDRAGKCAGDYAVDAQSQPCVDALVSAGVRAQLLFGILEDAGSVSGATTEDRDHGKYLRSRAAFDEAGETLLDEAGDAVMMEWERPLMAAHADLVLGRFPDPACERLASVRGGLRILNVGHGLGIVDTYIQQGKDRIADHCICEPHPDVLERMGAWRETDGVTVRAETWQEALADPTFGPFDGIFFDTYAETYADMRDFFKALPRLLARGGVFSYFNGVAPFNPFFHGVACEFIKTELEGLGLTTTFVPLKVDQVAEDTWDGVRRRYWQFDCYHMPICTFSARAGPASEDDPAPKKRKA